MKNAKKRENSITTKSSLVLKDTFIITQNTQNFNYEVEYGTKKDV